MFYKPTVLFNHRRHIRLSGCANKQNMCFRNVDNFRHLTNYLFIHNILLSDVPYPKLWILVASFTETEWIVLVNSDHYVYMSQKLFLHILNEMDVRDMWFQREGARNTQVTCQCIAATVPGTPHFLERRSLVASTVASFSSVLIFYETIYY